MFDITGYVYRNFPEVRDYGNPVTDLQVSCPFCHSDTKLHMHVSIVKNVVHCFKCGYGGSWVSFVMDNSGISYAKAIMELYVTPKIREDISSTLERELQAKSLVPDKKTNLCLPPDFQLLKDSKSTAALKVVKYLEGRGFHKEDWEYYNIGMCTGTHPMRVVIPIEDGYYQARTIPSWLEPKYINPKSEARHYIFNSSALDLYSEVVICEGAFSAMAVGRNAVALLGKELTKEKLERLLDSKVETYIVALDYDAEKHAVAIADNLYKGGKTVKMWKFSDERDPADGGVYEELSYDFSSKLQMLL